MTPRVFSLHLASSLLQRATLHRLECIGMALCAAAYLWPSLHGSVAASGLLAHIVWTKLVAAGTCVLIVALLYRNVRAITRMAWVLWAGMLLTIGTVICVAGFTHFHASMAFSMPPHAFTLRFQLSLKRSAQPHRDHHLRLLGLL